MRIVLVTFAQLNSYSRWSAAGRLAPHTQCRPLFRCTVTIDPERTHACIFMSDRTLGRSRIAANCT